MTALKEIKNRIISVRSTLKITSAMKMVASAKLHRVQAVATSLGEYERRLSEIAAVLSSDSDIETASPLFCRHEKEEKATIVAFSSNSSLCGGFNTNAYRALTKEIEQLHDEGFKQIQVIPIGAKIAQSAIKGGYDVDNSFNTLTEKSGRREFSSPAYDKNFNDDIKKMNLIGGIDFSKLYNFRDVRLPKLFEKGYKADTTHLEQTPGAPNYEAWITQKSQLKRYSRQTLELPNFTGNRLVQEREARPKEERVQPFKILPMAVADKIYPYMKHPLSAAVQLVGEKKEIRLYPHGAMDIIGRPNSEGVAKIKTVNPDGSYETGQLLRGRKN